MIRSIKTIALAVAITSVVAAFWYVSGLRADLERSKQNVITLENSIEEQIEVIDRMQDDLAEIVQSRREIQELINNQVREIGDLRQRFNESADGSERDFGKLALEKSGLIENIINKASATAIRCMEIASGSEITQEEINENFISNCGVDSSP